MSIADEYDLDAIVEARAQKSMDRYNKAEAERQATATHYSCGNCRELIPQADRGPGVRYCSPMCKSLDETRGDPGDLTYIPRTDHERTAHRKALRSKQYG